MIIKHFKRTYKIITLFFRNHLSFLKLGRIVSIVSKE
nr:MAG TPA: hypothetical protein [Caudoviricetes sp.]